MFLCLAPSFLPSRAGAVTRVRKKEIKTVENNYVSFIDRETGDNRREFTKLHRALTTVSNIQAKTAHAFPFTQYSTHAMHRFSEERDERREAREA